MLKNKLLNVLFPEDSVRGFFYQQFEESPFFSWRSIWRSLKGTWALTGRPLPIKCLVSSRVRLVVERHRTACATLAGRLIVRPWGFNGVSALSL